MTNEVVFPYSKLGEFPCGCGTLKLLIIARKQPKHLIEIFILLDKSGTCASGQLEAIGKLIGVALTAGVGPESIIKHLDNIHCPKGISCATAASEVLGRVYHPMWLRRGITWDKHFEEKT